MRCSWRSSEATRTGAVWRLARPAAVAAALVLAVAVTPALGQTAPPSEGPPVPLPGSVNGAMSAGATVANLGSSFLERLGDQATSGLGSAFRSNPGGGGASEAASPPRFRTWGEAYGISSSTGPQGVFAGDHRGTLGGVAGFGATLAPGVNIGFTADQSQTDIDVPLALQSAGLDLTQLGFNASIDRGHGPGRSRWFMASATSIRAAIPDWASPGPATMRGWTAR